MSILSCEWLEPSSVLITLRRLAYFNMKIAVASCLKYADCWPPFTALFRKFWPDCPYEMLFITDKDNPGQSWCSVVSDFAARTKGVAMLVQEDFWFNAAVNTRLVEHGLKQMMARNAAMVRLYPCPGGEADYGDPYFAEIPKGTRYRVSCQISLWRTEILAEIASHFNTPAEFELEGTLLSDRFDEPFLAFKRSVQPWPLSYFCSAVSRSKFEPAALEFCKQQGIDVDTSMRPIA